MEIQFQNNITSFASQNIVSEKMPLAASKNTESNVTDVPYRVTISKEGYQSYRESLQKKEDPVVDREEDREGYKALLSKAVMIGQVQEEFWERYKKEPIQAKDEYYAYDLAGCCLKVYTQMYDEIKSGYADGSRERWIVDSASESGFRKLTEEEELAELDAAFDLHAQFEDAYVNRFMGTSAEILDARERLYAFIEKRQYIPQTYEQPVRKIERLHERLMASANMWKERYSVGADNLDILFNEIFCKNFLESDVEYDLNRINWHN